MLEFSPPWAIFSLLKLFLWLGSFLSPFPLVPGPGGKEGSACLGTGITGTNGFNLLDHQHPSSPQGEVEGAVVS